MFAFQQPQKDLSDLRPFGNKPEYYNRYVG